MSTEILRKYIDIINEQETLNEEMLEEGMLQRLAGFALGTVLALGPKIGQADTVYSYLPANGTQMQTAMDFNQIPKDAKAVFEIDTDTKTVHVLSKVNFFGKKPGQGQEVKPDPTAVKQGQQGQAQVAAQPQAQQPQAQQPQAQQMQPTTDGFRIKHVILGMSEKELEQAKKDAGIRSGWLSSKEDSGIDTLLGVKFTTPLSARFENDKLVYVSKAGIEPRTAFELIEQFTAKFGKPTYYDETEVMNKMGAKFPSTSATWIKDGAHIVIKTTGGWGRVDTGSFFIFDQEYLKKSGQDREQKKTSNLTDFE